VPEPHAVAESPQIRRFFAFGTHDAEQMLANRHPSRRRPMKLTWKPHMLSALAAIAITTCLTIASAAPVVTVATFAAGYAA
jgi:hypothetical protein